MKWTEENLEKFIKENKEKFGIFDPAPDHAENFLEKLYKKFKKIISIVPYLVKTGIVTVLVFTASFFIWKAYVCPPLTHASLKYYKIEHLYKYEIKHESFLVLFYIQGDSAEIKNYNDDMQKFNISYDTLDKKLRKNPSNDNILNMMQFYQDKLAMLTKKFEYYKNK
jgi:hypothetical protein